MGVERDELAVTKPYGFIPRGDEPRLGIASTPQRITAEASSDEIEKKATACGGEATAQWRTWRH